MKKQIYMVAILFVSAAAFAETTTQSQNDPNKRCVPNFENGQPAGYKCFDSLPTGNFQKLGLKNGDTIQTIDGQPVNDPQKAMELLNQKPKKLNISRNGNEETVDTNGNTQENANQDQHQSDGSANQ